MARRSRQQIARLVERVGSDTVFALALNCETRVVPRRWMTGDEEPSEQDLDRMDRLEEILDAAAMRIGDQSVKRWFVEPASLDGHTAPHIAFRNGRFGEVLKAAERATQHY